MTRIVLFLTAVPIAAILALILNSLLERATERPQVSKTLAFLVSAVVLLGLGATAPATAHSGPTDEVCATLECSLTVDKQALDELWSSSQPKRVKLLYQSRIPVTEETLRDSDESLVVDDRGQRRPPKGATAEDRGERLETPSS